MYYHEDEVDSTPPKGGGLLLRYLQHLAILCFVAVSILSCNYLHEAFFDEEKANEAFDWKSSRQACSDKQIRSPCGEGVCTNDGRVIWWNRCVLNPRGAPKSGLYCVPKKKDPIIFKCYFGCCDTRNGLACRSNYVNCID